MQIETVVAPLLGALCHVLAEPDGRCVVVDPGAGVVDDVAALVRRAGWTPVAVLLTHGHVDHTWDAAAVGDRFGVPVHVHEGDAYRLADPVGSLGPLGHQLAAMTGLDAPPAPADVRTFDAAAGHETPLALGDDDAVQVTALHSPGHTQGSTVYLVRDAAGSPVALTGDVLFAGSIGRTDLPGGDDAAMGRTLARLTTLDPATRVLPGHGPTSTVAAELAGNPYLRPHR
ncbi:MBL fold metallo-hydrolase [Actinotalea ferrariae]|uniref:MBL fold metallo-hydrolase n=1 Tax=Actinotalea ferrariae TaxID=1386098 RepID=UPI001C8BA692|nr:MBL fold metallo-hydrolase [Actinotalea ferrariae]MBX9246864.1 MBL fold metallo-hydrolase [Actinotalea ferrariae]